MGVLEKYSNLMMEKYENFPQGKFLTLFILRKAESEVIFRTEGSGEDLSKEVVYAGIENRELTPRVVISKRKQTAVERRTGRELLRTHSLLFYDKGKRDGKLEDICALNRNKPCGICADCMIYGYAVGGGGAQKSRVITDDAFSILPYTKVTAKRTFNALYDNNTMRDPITNEPSSSIQEDQYIKPETLFIDMETLKDLTPGEVKYVFGNISRSRRYGAISSRMGKMRNELVHAIFSDCELFSNLELTQKVFDLLKSEDEDLSFPLDAAKVKFAMLRAIVELSDEVAGNLVAFPRDEVATLVSEIRALFSNTERVAEFLQEITNLYAEQG